MFEKPLQAAGLTPGEAQIYELLLNMGPSPAQIILKKTELKRGNVYNILDSLAKKGLVTLDEAGKKTVFKPVSPNALNDLMAKQEESTRQGKRQIEDVFENLRSLYALTQEKPVIRYFEGLEGIKAVTYDTLRAKGLILSYIDSESVEALKGWNDSDYVKKRRDLGIKKRIIDRNSQVARDYYRAHTDSLTEVRLASSQVAGFKTAMQVYNDSVSYVTLEQGKMIGVIIDDARIAALHRSMFESLWGTLPAAVGGGATTTAS